MAAGAAPGRPADVPVHPVLSTLFPDLDLKAEPSGQA